MNYPIKIVGCVVDVHSLTMYKADGDTIVIPQGDPRVKDLVAKLVPAMDSRKPQPERFYMLQIEDMQDKNHFAEAEKKMGGVVRFFKMVKSKAKELLDKFVEPVEPMELGDKREAVKVPPEPIHVVNGVAQDQEAPVLLETEPVKPKLPPVEERPLTRSEAAVAEIMAAAKPATSRDFSTPDVQGEEETTVLAVLADNTIIPGCEALVNQAQAVSEGISSGTGMENFMRRAGMIKRGHSVEDLLKFIQKGELPIADDGCVLVYKLLNRTSVEGEFVDCHSGRVKQRVGSRVHMAESMVDARRSQDCSNGLHVARRDYLRTFGGGVCVLAKLAPEDVIAVPQYDARKLRAKGYHIIAELTEADRRRVCNDQPMEDQVLLGNCIAGNHVGILEYVEITASKGGGLVVTPVEGAVAGLPALDQELKGTSLDHLPNVNDFDIERNSVDARALALDQSVAGVAVLAVVEDKLGDQIVDAAKELLDKSALAVVGTKTTNPDGSVSELVDNGDGSLGVLTTGIPIGEPVMFNAAAAVPIPAPTTIFQPGGAAHIPPVVEEPRLSSAVVPNSTKRPIDVLVERFVNADIEPVRMDAARALLAYKKQCKKSWTALGVPIAVWEKATQMVDAHMTPAKTETEHLLKSPANAERLLESVAQAKEGNLVKVPVSPPKAKTFKAPAKPKPAAPALKDIPKVKKAAPAKPAVPKRKAELTQLAAVQPKAVKMTQQEGMAKLVEIYNRNPDKQNAKEIVAFKQKAKKGWDVLGVTDAKFIKKITERAKL